MLTILILFYFSKNKPFRQLKDERKYTKLKYVLLQKLKISKILILN